MIPLETLVEYCDQRTRRREIPDYPGAWNGLQVGKRGPVRKVGAAVDASLEAFQGAVAAGIDFLIVHHGLFWNAPWPLTGRHYERVRTLCEADCAVYSSHLPLDCHPELGNNALLARRLGLSADGWFTPFQGLPIGLASHTSLPRAELRSRLAAIFPRVTAIETGPERCGGVGVLTGMGAAAFEHLRAAGLDTLVTGELHEHHFQVAQEEGFNVYLAGHYATEVFGVQALAAEVSACFGVPWEFLPLGCPL